MYLICHGLSIYQIKQSFMTCIFNIAQEPSGLLSQLLMIDEQLTVSLGSCAQPKTQSQKILKVCCMCLELSGHGVPWFVLSGLLLLLYSYMGDQLLLYYGLNLLAILVVDIIVVAPIKILFKRPRPPANDGPIPMSMSSVDNYAFPSGHASRCVALAALFCYIPPFYLHTHLWYIWAILVSLSRVVIGRHHILDVVAGILAGLVIFDLVRRLGLLMGV